MVGILAYAAAGALEGYGVGLVSQAQNAREAALEAARNAQRDRERAEDRAYDTSVRNDGRAYEEGQAAADRARTDATTARNANVYESLFGTESGGNFNAANDEGYTGRSQFGEDRLADYSRATGSEPITPEQFRSDPELQQRVEQWHFKDINKFIDDNDLMEYDGQTIDGVPITRSGMIAMAHLGGAGGMQRFLETNGEYNPADSNGTNLSDYAKTHGGLSTDMGDVWEMIADPNTPAPLRDAALTEVQRRNGIGIAATLSLSGEEWRSNGDGTETRWGAVDGTNTMQPYLDADGQLFTREEQGDDIELSAGLDIRLRRNAILGNGDLADPGPDEDAVLAAKSEILRLMTEEGMSEQAAEIKALQGMVFEDIMKTQSAGLFGMSSEEVPSGRMAFTGQFSYRDAPADAADAPADSDLANPPADVLAQARDAIAQGADPEAVKQRLAENGYNATGL